MTYNGTIYRPPVESDTFLLPVTEGCTHNSCTFCNMYRDIPFRMLSLSEVEEYLQEVRQTYDRYCERIQRVYLVGADPFALSADRLLERIELIRKYLPNTKVITMYARTDNIASKSDEDLKRLQKAGVDDLYIGVECGLNDVLENLNKGYSADDGGELYQSDTLLQVVGHTPVEKITREGNLISCDVFSTDRDRKPIGTQEYLIIDTLTWAHQGIR